MCNKVKIKAEPSWQSKYNIENLIFEGGGIKSIGYGGALTTMDSLGLLDNVKRVGGTSAGAITACLMALGYTPKEIAKIIVGTKFSSFEDDSFGVIRDTIRLVRNYGWNKGDTFKEWLGDFVEEKLGGRDATFSTLKRRVDASSITFGGEKDLYVVVTNLTKQRAEVYSAETTPGMPIVDAVRISMSIPIFFQCVLNKEGDILVDGGVANNFPIKLFDKRQYYNPYKKYPEFHAPDKYITNLNTLGFRLDTKDEIKANEEWTNAHMEINNVTQYMSAVITYLMEMANKRHLKACDHKRTIFIETGDVKATDFDLDAETVKMLIENGQKAVYDYFDCQPI